ncbi:hemerythrin domain-containing protein [Azospirillum sp. B510]|uniref:hemerythrin domain-containing protein n=1 Tax=Azospirillum sp. (strain B510) TaxID=137722 RepID=UPI00031C074C|nr:hemerythrin domain-containing protein [Azospirillum sp. B510]
MDAIRIIKDEHFAIAAVLHALRHQIRAIRGGAAPDFPLLRAILDYIVSYPDHWHHPKEDRFLFAAIRRRAPEAEDLLGRLEREHALGYPMIETLKRQLVRFEAGDDGAAEDFFATAERYAALEYGHLQTEEEQLLPLAERTLTAEDWREIDDAFRENDNPLFGLKPREEAERLYQRILDLAPPPIGYGRRDADR